MNPTHCILSLVTLHLVRVSLQLTAPHLPNIQTSLADVKRLKLIDSGAIHLIGSLVTEAVRMTPDKKSFLVIYVCIQQNLPVHFAPSMVQRHYQCLPL